MIGEQRRQIQPVRKVEHLHHLGRRLVVRRLVRGLHVVRAAIGRDPPERRDPLRVPFLLQVCIAGCAAGVVIMGLYPKPMVMAAMRVASTLF